MNFSIGARHIGKPDPCFIIAEVGLAHDGSLSQAHAYVDAVKAAGADAVKFQCHLGDSTDQWRVEPSWKQDVDRQAYWYRTDFTEGQWWGLAAHAEDVGLTFLCSPFSVEAVRMLNPLVKAWKMPSGRIADTALLEVIGATHKPVLLSTGMSTYAELDAAISRLVGDDCPVKVLQCTTSYPCPPSRIGLPLVQDWDGLSDHSGTIYPGIAAAALGCEMLEVHVCWSKDQGGFDTAASITTAQLGELVRGVRFVEAAMGEVDKDALAEQLSETRKVFMGMGA